MRRLIIAYTPYHAFLATAVLQNTTGENHLLIVRDFGGAEHMAAVLSKSTAQPYATATAVGGSYGVTSRLRRQFRYRRSAVEIARSSSRLAPEEIWVGNDARPESHAAFRAAAALRERPRGVFVEDGMTAYAASVTRPLAPWEQAAGYLVFGSLWSGISVLGTSGLVSKGLFIHPNLVRPELTHLAKTPIDRKTLFSPAMRALASEMVRAAGDDPERVGRVNGVVTATHSTNAERSPEYRKQMVQFVRQLVERGFTVGVKYHPRQAEPDYLGVGRDSRVMLLPRGLPLEYVYVLAAAAAEPNGPSQRLRLVIGDVSTTLLTARWVVPEAQVVSLGRPLGLLDPDIEQLFAKLGISAPASLESIW